MNLAVVYVVVGAGLVMLLMMLVPVFWIAFGEQEAKEADDE